MHCRVACAARHAGGLPRGAARGLSVRVRVLAVQVPGWFRESGVDMSQVQEQVSRHMRDLAPQDVRCGGSNGLWTCAARERTLRELPRLRDHQEKGQFPVLILVGRSGEESRSARLFYVAQGYVYFF